jgi:hypothetical protein
MNKKYVRCSYCGQWYTLGVDGTVDGCDTCMEIIRNQLDGTIIEDYELDEPKGESK